VYEDLWRHACSKYGYLHMYSVFFFWYPYLLHACLQRSSYTTYVSNIDGIWSLGNVVPLKVAGRLPESSLKSGNRAKPSNRCCPFTYICTPYFFFGIRTYCMHASKDLHTLPTCQTLLIGGDMEPWKCCPIESGWTTARIEPEVG
jgi:hypothetical protein